MTTRTIPIARSSRPEASAPQSRRLLVFGAPLVGLLAGIAAEWLDFRELRVPLLLMVGLGVLATAAALTGPRPGTRPGWRMFTVAVASGVATWAGAEAVYTVIHGARGESFHAERFGPQWSQALGLIAAHGLFLGAPTGAAAGLMLQWRPLTRRIAGR
jgi:hypothetical protein